MSSDEKMIEAIKKILSRGNTAEIKKRKNDVIILEVEKKITYQTKWSREFCDICKISGFFCLLGSEELGY